MGEAVLDVHCLSSNSGLQNTIIHLNATKDLKVKDSFLGKVRNKGNATVRRMNRVRV